MTVIRSGSRGLFFVLRCAIPFVVATDENEDKGPEYTDYDDKRYQEPYCKVHVSGPGTGPGNEAKQDQDPIIDDRREGNTQYKVQIAHAK